MKKKLFAAALAFLIAFASTACSTGQSGSETNGPETDAADEMTAAYFSDSDLRDVTGETPNAEIVLAGSSGTISDSTRGSSGQTVTVTSKGIYRITGTSENVTVEVKDTKESGTVYLVLDHVTMANASKPCILVTKSEKVVIQCVGENTLTYTAASAQEDGAVYASDNITLNGSGSLTITSALHGIVGKDDVKITGAAITVSASSVGIKANDSVRIGGGELSVVSGHDGIQVSGSAGDCYFCQTDGSLTIDSGYDGISVSSDDGADTNSVYLYGGTLDIVSGGGSGNSAGSKSEKGVKCAGSILTDDGVSVNVSSADDAFHANGNVTIRGGEVTLSSSDDGVHADKNLVISAGTLNVTKSYEGLEAAEVEITGGDVRVTASDDGINASGGSDSASSESTPFFWNSGEYTGKLTVSGGTLYVNAGGDGLDVNGSLYVTGGLVIVEGPTDNGNGALDIGDSASCVASITGGTVLAVGSAGMAINFNSGTQCSALVSLSGSAGTVLTVDDGSDFTFTASKSFSTVVYSSPDLKEGESYTITAGEKIASADFSSGLYYTNVSARSGGRK